MAATAPDLVHSRRFDLFAIPLHARKARESPMARQTREIGGAAIYMNREFWRREYGRWIINYMERYNGGFGF